MLKFVQIIYKIILVKIWVFNEINSPSFKLKRSAKSLDKSWNMRPANDAAMEIEESMSNYMYQKLLIKFTKKNYITIHGPSSDTEKSCCRPYLDWFL